MHMKRMYFFDHIHPKLINVAHHNVVTTGHYASCLKMLAYLSVLIVTPSQALSKTTLIYTKYMASLALLVRLSTRETASYIITFIFDQFYSIKSYFATQMFVQLLVVFEYEVLSLKVVCFGSKCTGIDLRVAIQFSWENMPSDLLDCLGFISPPSHVSPPPPPSQNIFLCRVCVQLLCDLRAQTPIVHVERSGSLCLCVSLSVGSQLSYCKHNIAMPTALHACT